MNVPKMVKIEQNFPGTRIGNIKNEVQNELRKLNLKEKIKPNARIAITAGSRGIANIPHIVKAIVDELKEYGAKPFIVPAMGSHGGATAEGQMEMLHGLGITEEYCGCPILSSMEVVKVGETPGGMDVYLDKNAFESDGIILMGRVKVHTDFKSPHGIESGLLKMAAIGLGKHKQALLLHSYGIHGIQDIMPDVGKVHLQKSNILCGIAIVENALEETAKIEAIETSKIPEREQEILKFSASLMPKLPIEDIDLLIVDEIGKNISGTGMDTNIIGRLRILGAAEPQSPRIKYIFVRDLTEVSHGNALGIGLADLTTERLFNKIDLKAMNENVITSTFLQRGNIPLVLENDQKAIDAALRSNWGVPSEQARIVHIQSTLHIKEISVSENIYEELKNNPEIKRLSEPYELEFDGEGNIGGISHE